MKLALALSIALFACFVWGTYEHGERLAAETAAASANADADDLARQLDEADATHDHAATTATQAKAATEKQLNDLQQQLATAGTEKQQLAAARDDAKAKADQLTIDLAAAKDDLAKANAKLLTESNKTCPTQAVVDEQNITIAELRKQLADLRPKKTAAPKTKLEADIATAADSHKLLLAVFSQDKCLRVGYPCFRFNRDVLNRPETQAAIEGRYILSELNVDHDDVGKVKVHYTPAVGIYSPADKKWLKFFEPNMSPDTFVGQLETEKSSLTKESR